MQLEREHGNDGYESFIICDHGCGWRYKIDNQSPLWYVWAAGWAMLTNHEEEAHA